MLVEPVHRSWWARLAELAAGFGGSALLKWVFDWVLYPLVIFSLGLGWGGLVMSLASFAVCIVLLWVYDLLKRDWLGIEAIKALRLREGHRGWRRVAAAALNRGDAIAFVVLSIHFDPFVTTAYLRRGQFNGMSRRDWVIFVSSWALSNGFWIAACYLGISALTWLWPV